MTEEFNKCIEIVLKFEGGLSDHVEDRGGLTKYGISQKAYPEIDIKNLTLEKAKEIYYKDYWLKIGCHRIQWPLNLLLLDFGIHSGIGRSYNLIMTLQEQLNVKVDGKLGPKTAAIIMLSNTKNLSRFMLRDRLNFLCTIVQRSPEQAKFLKGWMNRIFDLYNITHE